MGRTLWARRDIRAQRAVSRCRELSLSALGLGHAEETRDRQPLLGEGSHTGVWRWVGGGTGPSLWRRVARTRTRAHWSGHSRVPSTVAPRPDGVGKLFTVKRLAIFCCPLLGFVFVRHSSVRLFTPLIRHNQPDKTCNRARHAMRLFVVLLSVLSCSALVLPVHTPRTVASFSSARAGPATMGFEDSLATMIDSVSAFFAKSGATKKPPVRGPAHSECRLKPRT